MIATVLTSVLLALSSHIAGKPVQVDCNLNYVEVAAMGLADVGGSYAKLLPSVCEGVDKLVAGARPNLQGNVLQHSERIGYLPLSLLVLVHESYHLSGVGNEAQTECYAEQRLESAAEEVGIDAHYAVMLADRAAAMALLILPPEYHNDYLRCSPGGEWDLHLGRWPHPWLSGPEFTIRSRLDT